MRIQFVTIQNNSWLWMRLRKGDFYLLSGFICSLASVNYKVQLKELCHNVLCGVSFLPVSNSQIWFLIPHLKQQKRSHVIAYRATSPSPSPNLFFFVFFCGKLKVLVSIIKAPSNSIFHLQQSEPLCLFWHVDKGWSVLLSMSGYCVAIRSDRQLDSTGSERRRGSDLGCIEVLPGVEDKLVEGTQAAQLATCSYLENIFLSCKLTSGLQHTHASWCSLILSVS